MKERKNGHGIVGWGMIWYLLVISICFFVFFSDETLSEMEGNADTIQNKYKYAIDLGETDTAFSEQFIAGAEKAAEDYDVVLEIAGVNSSYRKEGYRFIETAIMACADAVITVGDDEKEWMELYKEYGEKLDQMVFVYNEAQAGADVKYVGGDNYQEGRMLASTLKEKAGLEKQKVVFLLSSKEQKEGNLRVAGFCSEDLQDQYFNIVQVHHVQDSVLAAMDVTEQCLLNDEDIDYFVCTNEAITIGAARAVIDLNRVGDTEVIGIGTSEEIERYLEKNIVSRVLETDAFQMGYKAVEVCVKNSEKMEREYIAFSVKEHEE